MFRMILPDAIASVQINWIKTEDYKERKRTKSILGKKPIQFNKDGSGLEFIIFFLTGCEEIMQVAFMAINILTDIVFIIFSYYFFACFIDFGVYSFCCKTTSSRLYLSKTDTLDGMFSLNKNTNKKAAYYKK